MFPISKPTAISRLPDSSNIVGHRTHSRVAILNLMTTSHINDLMTSTRYSDSRKPRDQNKLLRSNSQSIQETLFPPVDRDCTHVRVWRNRYINMQYQNTFKIKQD